MPNRDERVRRRRGSATVTIHEVAARAGVSVATVSRVLNGKQVVRVETSRRVLAASATLHYVPNVAARSLSIQRTQTIGVVLPEVHGEFFSEVIRGLDVAARAERYHILVSGSHSDMVEMLDVLGAMRGRVDGLAVMAPDVSPATLREYFHGKTPVVLLNSTDGEHDAITIDNFGGARAMMRHLARLGHTRIAFVSGPETNIDARERLRGYRHGMRTIGPTAGLVLDGDFTEAGGYDAAKALFARDPLPTAVFFANDSMAVGALSAFAESGLSVPDEITVVGFDDIRISHYLAPSLTTIAVDTAELGRRAFALLRDGIAQPRHPQSQERIATRLVVRRSCAAPAIRRIRKRTKSIRGKEGEES